MVKIDQVVFSEADKEINRILTSHGSGQAWRQVYSMYLNCGFL